VLFHDPSACSRIQRELEEELVVHGVDRLADIIGRAHESVGFAVDRHGWVLRRGLMTVSSSILHVTRDD
jgi:hypothetical protein